MDSNAELLRSWLKLGYLGSVGYLERNSDRLWSLGLQTKTTGTRTARVCAIEYDVVFDSKQSYSFLKKLGLAEKHRNVIPKKRPRTGQKKKRMERLVSSCPDCLCVGLLRRWMPPAMGRSLRLCLGKTDERIEVPIINGRQANLLWSR